MQSLPAVDIQDFVMLWALLLIATPDTLGVSEGVGVEREEAEEFFHIP